MPSRRTKPGLVEVLSASVDPLVPLLKAAKAHERAWEPREALQAYEAAAELCGNEHMAREIYRRMVRILGRTNPECHAELAPSVERIALRLNLPMQLAGLDALPQHKFGTTVATSVMFESTDVLAPCDGPADSILGPRSRSAQRRVGDLDGTNPNAVNAYVQAVRRVVESEQEVRTLDARERRIAAAWAYVHTTELTLLARACKVNPRAEHWLKAVWAKKERGPSALCQWIRYGKVPSLMLIGSWICAEWRIGPEWVADEVQRYLGIPVGVEDDVYRVGVLRNVLAHRSRYERLDAVLPLEVAHWVVRRSLENAVVVDVDQAALERLGTVVRGLVKGQ